MKSLVLLLFRIFYLALWVLVLVTLFEHGPRDFVGGLRIEADHFVRFAQDTFTRLTDKSVETAPPDAPPPSAPASPPPAAVKQDPSATKFRQELNEREKQSPNLLGPPTELETSPPPQGAP